MPKNTNKNIFRAPQKKIAILLTGFSSNPSRDFLDEIRSAWPNYEFECHIFTWSNWNSEQLKSTFSGENFYEFDWREYETEINSIVRKFKLNAPEGNPINTISMFKLWKLAANNVAKINADYFIKLRVDNVIYFKSIKCGFFDGFHGLSIPSGGDHRGGIGDHMAFGSRVFVEKYLNAFDSLSKIAEIGYILHPETMLRYHLINMSSMAIRRVPLIVFCRGIIYNTGWNDDCTYIDESRFEIDKKEYLHVLSRIKSYRCREHVDSKINIYINFLYYRIVRAIYMQIDVLMNWFKWLSR